MSHHGRVPAKRPLRIVFTGGPGGGKTTAADLFRRELGESFVIVPETASLLFLAGFPRTEDAQSVRATQAAIFHVQRNLEDVQTAHYPERILLCDRGTVDGGAYWPGGADEFYASLGTTLDAELARYAAVLFFESAAVGGIAIEGGNRARIETIGEAAALDQKLRRIWSRHPRFHLVPHDVSFLRKMQVGLDKLREVLAELKRS